MWWAGRSEKSGRAIQDRWCADASKSGFALNQKLSGVPSDLPTQMAIPLHKEFDLLNQLIAAIWRAKGRELKNRDLTAY